MNSSTTDLPIAHIVQDHCVVWDYTHASELFELEFFGKPVGIRKPNDFDFKRPLQLSLFDTAYLLEFNIIKVINHQNNEKEPCSYAAKPLTQLIGMNGRALFPAKLKC